MLLNICKNGVNLYISLFLILFCSSCACITEFVSTGKMESGFAGEYRLECSIKEGAYKEENDLLNIDFDFCTYADYPIKCSEKKLLDSTVSITPVFKGSNSVLQIHNKYASVYTFTADDFNTLWKKNDILQITLEYQVDSLGTILSRAFTHTLKKKITCRKKLVLH